MAISAVNTIPLALEHAKRQLFRPFRFWQWARLAAVGLLAGELGGGGGNFNLGPRSGQQPQIQVLRDLFHKIDPAVLASLATVLVITGIVLAFVFAYISSVMRFILFDSILTKECHIRAGWSRRQDIAWKYFLWQVGLGVSTFAGTIVIIGGPAVVAFSMGWFQTARAHVAQLVVLGIFALALLLFFIISIAIVHVFSKDFVVPQMAFEGIGALEAWRRLWPMIEGDAKAYLLYILMKIVLSIVAGIAIGVVGLTLGLILAVPIVGAVIAAVIAGKSAGWTLNAVTITAAVAAGCLIFAIFFFLVSLISVPAIVFFPAYSIYFFAARYQPLSLALYAPAPTGAVPGGTPYSPPPLPAV